VADIAFLGYGRMAQAISAGLDASGRIPFARQAASDLPASELSGLSNRLGIRAAASNAELASLAPVIVVAVKPHQVRSALKEIAPAAAGRLVVSIAAGVDLAALADPLPGSARVVRVIPNLPALAGHGVTLLCAPEGVPRDDVDKVRRLFESVGSVFELPESLFNEGTAVSGSGPAYFWLFMEAMVRGAVRLGLPWDLARQLVVGTCLGSAATALARPDLGLAELRDQVTSPGGTTAAGLLELERGALTALVHEALASACERGRRLA
jgi:pyrroline-5-carboxylate reductase